MNIAGLFKIPKGTAILVAVIILAGFDVASVRLSIGNLRISLLILALLLVYYAPVVMSKRTNWGNGPLAVFFISTGLVAIAGGHVRSLTEVVHWASIVVIFFTIGRVMAQRMAYNDVIRSYLIAFRLQIAFAFLGFLALGGRADLLYYEPSYFVLASVPYVFIAMRRTLITGFMRGKGDVAMIGLMIVATQSATLMMLVILALAAASVRSVKTFIPAFALAIGICFMGYYLGTSGGDNLIANTVRNITFSNDPLQAALDRGGNRWPRVLLAAAVIRDNWFLGVGPGQFADATSAMNLDAFVGDRWWMKLGDKPAVNVAMELLVDVGVIPTLIIVFYVLRTISRSFRGGFSELGWSLILIMTLLMGMSSLFRPYVWLLLGLASAAIPTHRTAHN